MSRLLMKVFLMLLVGFLILYFAGRDAGRRKSALQQKAAAEQQAKAQQQAKARQQAAKAPPPDAGARRPVPLPRPATRADAAGGH